MEQLIEVDIRRHWQEIYPGLQEICLQHGGMIPEDYYVMVIGGHASLCQGERGDGFVILRVVQKQDGPGNKTYRVLRVMAAWSKIGNARRKYLPAIDAIARQEQCMFAEFDTTKRGFLKDPDWFLDKMVFRREVKYGEE